MTDSTPIASFIDEDANSEQTLTEVEGNARVRQKTVMIEFPKDDPEDPYNWSNRKKWILIGLGAAAYSFLTAVNATAYPIGSVTMIEELNCSYTEIQLGNTAYLLSCAFAPMVLAPLSEQFGRYGLFLGSHLVYTLMFVPQALAHNVWYFVGFRILQGAAGSAGNSIVGGVVSDCFAAEDRSLPMALFAVLIMSGQALGGLFGWVDLTLGFRWIAWINLIISGVHLAIMGIVFRETRGSALLDRRAARLTKETGILHVTMQDDTKARPTMSHLISKSVKRPFILLFTEPIVTFFSLYVSFLWGVVFLAFASIRLVFAQYGWNRGLQGTTFLAIMIGSILGALLNRFQDRLYARDARKSPINMARPESRLYGACVGAVGVPVALFMFAWTGRPQIHWIAPAISLVIFMASIFPIYLAVFVYLADAYNQYASSALAAQSFTRNVFAATFPLFAVGMYDSLGYPAASSTLAGIAIALIPIPVVLFKYGEKIRSKSRIAKRILAQEERRLAAKGGTEKPTDKSEQV